MNAFRLLRPSRWKTFSWNTSPNQLAPGRSHSPQLRYKSSLIPRPEVPPSKPSHGLFSDLGDPEANKPMFEQLALLTPTVVPDDPLGVIRPHDSAAKILNQSALVVERKLEMLNVFLVTAFLLSVLMSRATSNAIATLLWIHKGII